MRLSNYPYRLERGCKSDIRIFTRTGKEFTKWFDYDGVPYRWQIKGKLLNEYRTDEGEPVTPVDE